MTAARHREPPSTCAWAEATGGALDPLQRRRVLRAIARGFLDLGVGLASRPMRRPVPVDIPTAPDSKLAREAESAAREQGATLAGHGYRTWLLGHALACQDRQVLDPELFTSQRCCTTRASFESSPARTSRFGRRGWCRRW